MKYKGIVILAILFIACFSSTNSFSQELSSYKTQKMLNKQWLLIKFETADGKSEDLTSLNNSWTIFTGDKLVKQDSKTITMCTWSYNHKKSLIRITDPNGTTEYTILSISETDLELDTEYKGKKGKLILKKVNK